MQAVSLKNSLKQHSFVFGLIKKASDQVKLIENYSKLKNSKQLTQYVIELVESEFDKTYHEKVDRKTLVSQIIQSIFPDLSADEVKNLEDDIEFIYDNMPPIKKKTFLKKVIKLVVSSVYSSSSRSDLL